MKETIHNAIDIEPLQLYELVFTNRPFMHCRFFIPKHEWEPPVLGKSDEFISFDKRKVEDYGIAESLVMLSGLESRHHVSDRRDLVTL